MNKLARDVSVPDAALAHLPEISLPSRPLKLQESIAAVFANSRDKGLIGDYAQSGTSTTSSFTLKGKFGALVVRTSENQGHEPWVQISHYGKHAKGADNRAFKTILREFPDFSCHRQRPAATTTDRHQAIADITAILAAAGPD